jgi:DNA-binding CsgD family transcriptional regulator
MLIASGHSTVEIAELLRISPGTVENHKRRVYAKLNATNSVQAVARATVLGLIDSAPVPPSRTSPMPWREISAGDPAAETRHTMLALALGEPGEALDRVVRTLIAHGLPVLHELWPQPLARAHWLGWHRGPIVTIMIDPTAEHWRAAGALGGTGVVVHSEPLDERALVEALTNTIAAVVSADHIEERLVPVLTLAVQGCVVLEQATAGPLLDRACVQFAERRAQVPTLTPREFDVLKSIGRYHTVRQTANALGIAAKTVENARVNLFRKLGVRNQTGALAAAYSLGLLKADNT